MATTPITTLPTTISSTTPPPALQPEPLQESEHGQVPLTHLALPADQVPETDENFHFLSYKGRKDQSPFYKTITEALPNMSLASRPDAETQPAIGQSPNEDSHGEASDDEHYHREIEKGLLSFQSDHFDSANDTSPNKTVLPHSTRLSRTAAIRADTEKDSQILSADLSDISDEDVQQDISILNSTRAFRPAPSLDTGRRDIDESHLPTNGFTADSSTHEVPSCTDVQDSSLHEEPLDHQHTFDSSLESPIAEDHGENGKVTSYVEASSFTSAFQHTAYPASPSSAPLTSTPKQPKSSILPNALNTDQSSLPTEKPTYNNSNSKSPESYAPDLSHGTRASDAHEDTPPEELLAKLQINDDEEERNKENLHSEAGTENHDSNFSLSEGEKQQESSTIIHPKSSPPTLDTRLQSMESIQSLGSIIPQFDGYDDTYKRRPTISQPLAAEQSKPVAPRQQPLANSETIDASESREIGDSDNDSDYSDSIHDRTQHILQRASTYKFSLSPSDDESAFGDATVDKSIKQTPSKTRGLKEETKAIETLQHENFELKLRIVCMEDQALKNSEAGVAELKKQLVAAQAARIAMKHENEKLRKTISTLKANHEEESHRDNQATIEQLYELQEKLEDFEIYNTQLQTENSQLRESLIIAEETITNQEASIESYKNNINELIVQKEELEEDLESAQQTSSTQSLNNIASSLHAQNDNLRKRLDNSGYAAPPTPRSTNRVIEHFHSIQKALSIPVTSSSRSSSRAGSNSFDLDGILPDENPVLSSMLNQIQAAAWEVSNKYRNSLAEYEALQHQLQNYKNALEDERISREELERDGNAKLQYLGEALEERDIKLEEQEALLKNRIEMINNEVEDLRIDSNNKVSRLESQLKDKAVALDSLQKEYDFVQNEVRSVNDDIDQLSSSLALKDNELLHLKEQINTTSAQLNSKNEVISAKDEELALKDQELVTKDRKLEELRKSYSNAKDESKKLAVEIQTLEELVQSLKNSFDKLEIGTLEKGIESVAITTTDAQDLLKDILKRTQDTLTNESVTIESLRETLDNVLEDYRNISVLTAKLDETTAQNTKLFNNLEEQRKLEVELNAKLEEQQKMESMLKSMLDERQKTEVDLGSKIEELSQSLEQERDINKSNSSLQSTDISDEIAKLKDQLEEHQNEEQILREELDTVHKELTNAQTAYENLQMEHSQLQEKMSENERLTPEQFQQLNRDLESIASKCQSLENERNSISAENEELQQLNQELESQVQSLRLSDRKSQRAIKALENEIEDVRDRHDSVAAELERKRGKLSEISRDNTALVRENSNLRQSYDEANNQVETLEQQLAVAIHESSFHSSNSGSRLKDHTYHRMIELEDEVQATRERVRGLDKDVKRYKDKLNKRSDEFFFVLRNITTFLSKVLDATWTEQVAGVVEDIDRNAGSPVDNFYKLGNLICDGFKALDTKKRKYKVMAERFRQARSSTPSDTGANKPAYEPESNTVVALNNLENNTQIKQLSQQYELFDQKTIESVGGDIALKVWQYRFMDMKKRYEMERESRKLEYENYNASVKQLEDRYLQDRTKNQRPQQYRPQSMSSSSSSQGRVQDLRSTIERLTASSSPAPPVGQNARPYSRSSNGSRSSSGSQLKNL